MRPTPPRSRALTILALTLALAAFPLGTVASHQFSDVPDSNIFHADIDALVDAGVTSGCGGGKYCPSAFVTREQMAAFLNRLGALAAGKVPVVNAAELGGLTANQFVRSDVAVEGLFNCVGSVMQSPNSSANFSLGGNGRYLIAGAASFNCGVVLPDGATVTALRAGIRDAVTNGSVSCNLLRAPLFLYDTDPDWMANAESDYSAAPGNLTAEDPTIDFAVIDNDAYSYWVDCFINAASGDLTLNGVSVTYSFEGWAVP
jgi:hypothetical protein